MRDSNLREVLLWLISQRRRYRVTGKSMLPLLRAGDEVLVNPNAYRHQSPHVGDVVVADHPAQPGMRVIKRIKDMDRAGQCQLLGDNPDPAQNSAIAVPISLLQGRVTSRFSAAN